MLVANSIYDQQSPYNQRRLAQIMSNTIMAATLKPGEKDSALWPDIHDLSVMSRGVDITPCPSMKDSIANQIMMANGQLLPVEIEAFAPDGGLYSFENVCADLKRNTSSKNPREFYELLGIIARKPQDDFPGWYRCQLPNGWYAKQYTPTIGTGERIEIYDASDVLQFDILCSKFATAQCWGLSVARALYLKA